MVANSNWINPALTARVARSALPAGVRILVMHQASDQPYSVERLPLSVPDTGDYYYSPFNPTVGIGNLVVVVNAEDPRYVGHIGNVTATLADGTILVEVHQGDIARVTGWVMAGFNPLTPALHTNVEDLWVQSIGFIHRRRGYLLGERVILHQPNERDADGHVGTLIGIEPDDHNGNLIFRVYTDEPYAANRHDVWAQWVDPWLPSATEAPAPFDPLNPRPGLTLDTEREYLDRHAVRDGFRIGTRFRAERYGALREGATGVVVGVDPDHTRNICLRVLADDLDHALWVPAAAITAITEGPDTQDAEAPVTDAALLAAQAEADRLRRALSTLTAQFNTMSARIDTIAARLWRENNTNGWYNFEYVASDLDLVAPEQEYEFEVVYSFDIDASAMDRLVGRHVSGTSLSSDITEGVTVENRVTINYTCADPDEVDMDLLMEQGEVPNGWYDAEVRSYTAV